MADLGQWLNGTYRVAGQPASSDADHRDAAAADADDDAGYR